MKKLLAILICTVFLCGCTSEPVYETIGDSDEVPVMSTAYKVSVLLPEEASEPVMQSGGETLYRCENYSVMVNWLDGGDLNRTVQTVTGMDPSALTVLKTERDGFPCYRIAWSTAGEDGLQVCRCVILDDGAMHHAVTVMADHSFADRLIEQWNHVLDSVCLISTG